MESSQVAQSCPTLFNPMDCSLPGSSVHGIFQARVVREKQKDTMNNFMCTYDNLGEMDQFFFFFERFSLQKLKEEVDILNNSKSTKN